MKLRSVFINRQHCVLLLLVQQVKSFTLWGLQVLEDSSHALVILELQKLDTLSQVP